MTPLLVLGSIEFVRGALVFSLIPLYGRLGSGLSVELIGAAISLHYLCDNGFRLPAGWFADRFGGKRLTIFGLLVAGLGVLMIYNHWNATSFLLGAALYGLGVSPVWPVVISGISEKMPEHQISEALSKVYVAWLVGAGLGPVVVNFMVERTYRLPFLLLLGMLGTAAVFAAASLPRFVVRREMAHSVFFKELFQEIVSLKILYPGMFIQTMCIGILMPIIVIYANTVFGVTPSQFNYLLVGGGAFTVLLLVPAGKLADRLGVTRPLVGGFFAASVCLFLLPLQRQIITVLAVGAVLGISYSLILPAWNGLIARAVSPEKRGSMWAVFMTIEGLGTASGAMAGGWLWDAFGSGSPFFTSGFLLLAVGTFYAFGNIQKLQKQQGAGGGG